MVKQTLLRRLTQLAPVMVQGGLSETTRQGGNRGCVCYHDPAKRHGPHWYLTYREQQKSRSLYVPPEQAAPVRQAHAAWREFGEVSCALAALNRAQLRKARPQEKKQPRRRSD